MAWRRWLSGAVLGAVLLVPACGGGGGDRRFPTPLAITGLTVLTQPTNAFSPFVSTAGGDEVQLVGSRFTPNSRVRFGTLAAGRVTFVSDTELRATTPAGPPGAVDVTVQDDGGNETTLAAGLTYILPPVAQSLAALTGPTQTRARVPIAGNVEVQVTGRDFRNGAEVFVDGVAVPTTFVSGAAVTFTAPPRAADTTADVSVRNPEGLTATLSMTYTQEFSLDPQPDALTTAQAQHLFRRAAFGAPPPVIAQATADGLNLTLQKLMTITPDPNVDPI
ncbi:MAG: IPT/TIG domain-containing protein, partial [Planctomycetota bacterium]